MSLKDLLTGGLFEKAADAFKSRQERLQAEQTLEAKIVQAKQEGETQLQLSVAERDVLAQWQQQSTWKDEYVTVSLVAILNLVVVGGILSAFGIPEVLQGVQNAVQALTAMGVNVGMLLEITIYCALGLYSLVKMRGR